MSPDLNMDFGDEQPEELVENMEDQINKDINAKRKQESIDQFLEESQQFMEDLLHQDNKKVLNVGKF